jgi:hypothetical protein
MIHSLEYIEGNCAGEKNWYITTIFGLKKGDIVLVQLGADKVRAKVLRIDKFVSEQASPVPFSRAKNVIKKM